MTITQNETDAYTPPGGRHYLFTADLERIFGIPRTTWSKWRSLKKGPPYIKLGRRPAYLPTDVRQWADAQPRVRTSD